MSQFQSIFFTMNDVINPLPSKADKPKQLPAKAVKKRPAFLSNHLVVGAWGSQRQKNSQAPARLNRSGSGREPAAIFSRAPARRLGLGAEPAPSVSAGNPHTKAPCRRVVDLLSASARKTCGMRVPCACAGGQGEPLKAGDVSPPVRSSRRGVQPRQARESTTVEPLQRALTMQLFAGF